MAETGSATRAWNRAPKRTASSAGSAWRAAWASGVDRICTGRSVVAGETGAVLEKAACACACAAAPLERVVDIVIRSTRWVV